jgi:hypothetical protein
MSVATQAKERAGKRMHQQAEDLFEIVGRAYRGGFYSDAARAAQHLKHVLDCLSQNEPEDR